MNLNGKSIVAIRKLSTSKYLAGKKGEKKEKREKIVYGITLPAELLKVARFSAGKYVELDASPGRITVTFIAVKEIEQQKRDGAGKGAEEEKEGKGKRGKKGAGMRASKTPKSPKSGKSAVPGKAKNKSKKVEKKSRKASKSVKNTSKTAPKGVEKGEKVPEVVEMGVKTD